MNAVGEKMKIMETIDIDFDEREIIDNMIKFCGKIQTDCSDENLIDVATEIIEKIEELEEFIV